MGDPCAHLTRPNDPQIFDLHRLSSFSLSPLKSIPSLQGVLLPNRILFVKYLERFMMYF
jgi:hypothetical protein